MLRKINIPNEYIGGIDKIRSLSDEDFSSLNDTIRALPKGVSRKVFIGTLNEFWGDEESQLVSEAIFNFGELLVSDEYTDFEEIAKDVTTSFAESEENEDKTFDSEILKALQDRISNLLVNLTNVKLTFQAYDSIRSSENPLISTNVTTEVKLLFDKGNVSSIKNGVIYFKLNVRFRDKTRTKNETLTLDQTDLIDLKRQIEEALNEEESIKSKMKDINFVDTTTE
jgi:hypothetical protein